MQTDGQSNVPTKGKLVPTWLRMSLIVIGGVLVYGPVKSYFVGSGTSTEAQACEGLLKSPLCYLFGSDAAPEEPPFNVEYRAAIVGELGGRYGQPNLRLSAGPGLSEAEDVVGYEHWLGHASEKEFRQVLTEVEARLRLKSDN